MERKYFLPLLFLFHFFFATELAQASSSVGTISTESYTSRFLKLPEIAKTSTSSQDIYWNTQAPYHVEVKDSGLKGYLWGPLIGYISLSCENTSSCASQDFGVKNNNGELSGYAWGENTGWVSFNCANIETNNCASNNNAKVTITDTGDFAGHAWSQNFGWISFNCLQISSCVKTDWRKASLRSVMSSQTTQGGQSTSVQQFISPTANTPDSQKTIENKENSTSKTVNEGQKLDLKKQKENTTTKTTTQNEASAVPENGNSLSTNCTGATCAGISPFMFPLSSIAPNESQFKRLTSGNTGTVPAPVLTVDKTSENSTGLLSVFKKPQTMFEKVKDFFKKQTPQTDDTTSAGTEQKTSFISHVSVWIKNLFHR